MAFPFTIPSDEDISKDFYEREQTQLLVESQLLYKKVIEGSRSKTKTSTAIIDEPPVIVISKNDNIKRRVEKILAQLEEENQTFIVGKSQHTNKLISIVEIVKKNCSENGKRLHQFNKLTKVKSLNNPNYNYNKQTKGQKENLNNYLSAEDEYQKTVNEIRHGIKHYDLPVLNILLVLEGKEEPIDTEVQELVKAGWSHQSNDM